MLYFPFEVYLRDNIVNTLYSVLIQQEKNMQFYDKNFLRRFAFGQSYALNPGRTMYVPKQTDYRRKHIFFYCNNNVYLLSIGLILILSAKVQRRTTTFFVGQLLTQTGAIFL